MCPSRCRFVLLYSVLKFVVVSHFNHPLQLQDTSACCLQHASRHRLGNSRRKGSTAGINAMSKHYKLEGETQNVWCYQNLLIETVVGTLSLIQARATFCMIVNRGNGTYVLQCRLGSGATLPRPYIAGLKTHACQMCCAISTIIRKRIELQCPSKSKPTICCSSTPYLRVFSEL